MKIGESKKLSLGTKIIFGSGDLFGGGAFNMITIYYFVFLTTVVRISPYLAGIVVFLSKLWDAITDPLMGWLTDHTKSKLGKRRPYFFAGIFAVFISILLLWLPADFPTEFLRFLYAVFAYLIFSTVATMVMVPYLSMQPELSKDYNERTSLNVIKMAFSFVASIIVALVPDSIIKAAPDLKTGYFIMSLCFALLFSLPWLLIFLHIKEPANIDSPKTPFSYKEFLEPLQIKTFRYLIGIYLGAFLSMDFMITLLKLYVIYVLGRSSEFTMILGTLIITQLISLPLINIFAKRLGKIKVFIISAILLAVSVALIAFTPKNVPNFIAYVEYFFAGLGVGGCVVIPWTLYPDTVDLGKLYLQKECAGKFSGVMLFVRKLCAAVAALVIGVVLSLGGYIKPEYGQTAEEVIQPARTLVTMKILLFAGPLLLVTMAIYIAKKYRLNQNQAALIKQGLEGTLPEQQKKEVFQELV